ncbi:MAG: RHS repeat-associated core domain-containing protein, partial [Bacilli bacterium]|nr:RHS repeat-associated core domain-containing protein [Bacilli bacterium]
ALYKEGYGLQLTYNEDGDIEAAINEITNTNTEYEYEDGFIKTIKEDNIKTEVKRVDNTKWINYVVTNNIIQSFSYDVNGNLEELSLASKKIDPSDPNKYIPDIYLNSTSTIYTADKLYIDQKTDEYGRVTDFTFDYLTGLLKDTTFNGKTTSREYDSLQNLTKVTQGARSVEYVYEKKLLKEIKVDGLIYEFGYNNYKDVTSIKIAGTTVIENNYKDENTSKYSGLIEASSYGGDLLEFIYDKENRIKEVYVNGDMQIEYFYDSLGNISEVIDHKVDPSVTYYYNFDEENRLVTITSTDGNKVTYDYAPEDDGFLSSKTTINGKVDYNYISLDPDTEPEGKDKNKVISSESFINDAFSKEYNYQDSGLRKLDNTAIITSASTLTSKYTYDSFQKTVDGNVRFYETLRIKELDIKKNDVSLMRFVYSYDNYDNIKTILRYDNGSSYYSYYDYFDYNEYNELTYHAQIIGGIERINTYSYDLRGNIKTIYKVELQNGRQTSYSYITLTYEVSGWLDKLKSVTINGVTHYIDGYDVGNPNSYFNYNIMYEQRSIASIVSNDNFIELYFSYNANGIRTEKINNVKGVTTSYTLEGTRILKESRTDGKVLNYFYDQSGSIIGFKYNSNNYFYIKDLQNDIIGITNSNGNLIVTYVYDAYGSIVSINDTSGINLGVINPFRFKSYYFDEETKFYYLNSRYYDPLIGRFINADDIGMLAEGELNLFKYCDNNPVTGYDPMGTWNWGRFWKITGGVAGAAIAVTLVVATGGTALTLLSIGAGIAGYAVGSNIATVVESKHYVKHNDIASMPKDRYNEIVENMKTVGMSRDEKLSYIRYLKEKEPYNYRNWTEAQMMREFEYHDRGYALTSIFGNPFGFTNRFEKVDFEEDQKPCTYFYRTIGNMMFW